MIVSYFYYARNPELISTRYSGQRKRHVRKQRKFTKSAWRKLYNSSLRWLRCVLEKEAGCIQSTSSRAVPIYSFPTGFVFIASISLHCAGFLSQTWNDFPQTSQVERLKEKKDPSGAKGSIKKTKPWCTNVVRIALKWEREMRTGVNLIKFAI